MSVQLLAAGALVVSSSAFILFVIVETERARQRFAIRDNLSRYIAKQRDEQLSDQTLAAAWACGALEALQVAGVLNEDGSIA